METGNYTERPVVCQLPETLAILLAVVGLLVLAAVAALLMTARGRTFLAKNEGRLFPVAAVCFLLGAQAVVWGGASLLGLGAWAA